jgi:hypothetical protein
MTRRLVLGFAVSMVLSGCGEQSNGTPSTLEVMRAMSRSRRSSVRRGKDHSHSWWNCMAAAASRTEQRCLTHQEAD